MQVGNGTTMPSGKTACSKLPPKVYELVGKHTRKKRRVVEGLTRHAWVQDIRGNLSAAALLQFLKLWLAVSEIQLADESGRLIWRWSSSGCYSAPSCYPASLAPRVLVLGN